MNDSKEMYKNLVNQSNAEACGIEAHMNCFDILDQIEEGEITNVGPIMVQPNAKSISSIANPDVNTIGLNCIVSLASTLQQNVSAVL